MECTKCQFENREGAKFCRKCGNKLELICPSCSHSYQTDSIFCDECGHELSVPTETEMRSQTFDSERKHATVLFSDLVGYTAMAERLDPEEVKEIMSRIFGEIAQVLTKYEGFIERFFGDEVMALFGVPKAHEDDPVRAIRAAREIHHLVEGMSPKYEAEIGHPLAMHTGINTGLLVTGDEYIGKGRHGLTGDTVNLAARLTKLAQAGEILVGPDTYRHAEGYFIFEHLEPKRVKGKGEPVKAFMVIAPSARRTRFEVSAERGLTPLVGRERELEQLKDGFRQCKVGRGEAFSIVSEAGYGKSRLLYEFRKAVAKENATFLEGKCLSYRKGAAYQPVIDILKSTYDIMDGDGDSEIRGKVIAGLKNLGVDETSSLPFLLELLSVKDSGLDEISLSPEAIKDRIIDVLKYIFFKGSEIRPLIIAVEDLHWIDKSSEDAFKELLDSLSGVRIFLIFTFRPEYSPSWGLKSYHSQINLNRFSERESLLMLPYLLGTDNIDSAFEELILEKTEGVPFFIEEFVKTLKDLEIIEIKDKQWYLTKDIQELSIPSTVQDVIMAKIDLLPAGAKEVLQMGSAIEREFGFELIKRTTNFSERELLSHLAVLKDSELIYESRIFPNSTYVFKHALIQDVVNQTLLKSTRRRYHRKIAQVLEEDFPETVEAYPELLGRHSAEAGLIEPAIQYLQRAGEKALKCSAHVEALAYFMKGLSLLKNLPEIHQRNQHELTHRIGMGPALIVTKGYSAPEVEHNLSRAREICQQIGDTTQLFQVLTGLFSFHLVRAEYQTTYQLGEQMMSLAQRKQDTGLIMAVKGQLGITLFWLGEFTSAQDHLEQAIANFDPQQQYSHILSLPSHHMEHCLLYEALILQWLGYPDQAIKKNREAISIATKFAHPYTLATAMFFSAWLHYSRREFRSAQELANKAVNISSEHGYPFWRTAGTMLLGWALAEQGKIEEGIAKIHQGLDSYRNTGAEQWLPCALSLLAEAYGKAGKIEGGLQLLEEALTLVDKTEERWWEAELYRLTGELLLSLVTSDKVEAERNFRQAIDVARSQQTKSMELKAAVSLSRLWCDQDKRDPARKLLTEICGWFTEGFDTAEVKEAKVLLEKLK